MFTLIKQTKIAKIINSKRIYRDFLYAIKKIVFTFVEIYEFQLKIVMNYETQFIVIIDIFRHYMRIKKVRKKKSTMFNLMFVVDENKKINNRNSFCTFLFRKRY